MRVVYVQSFKYLFILKLEAPYYHRRMIKDPKSWAMKMLSPIVSFFRIFLDSRLDLRETYSSLKGPCHVQKTFDVL